jgi:hypothetical protein
MNCEMSLETKFGTIDIVVVEWQGCTCQGVSPVPVPALPVAISIPKPALPGATLSAARP